MFSEDLVFLIIKYFLEGIAVSVSAYYLTSKKTSIQETILVGISAATVFLLLDLFAPSVGSATRTGAGLGIGLNRVGFEHFDAANKKKKKVISGHKRGTAPKEGFEDLGSDAVAQEDNLNLEGFSF